MIITAILVAGLVQGLQGGVQDHTAFQAGGLQGGVQDRTAFQAGGLQGGLLDRPSFQAGGLQGGGQDHTAFQAGGLQGGLLDRPSFQAGGLQGGGQDRPVFQAGGPQGGVQDHTAFQAGGLQGGGQDHTAFQAGGLQGGVQDHTAFQAGGLQGGVQDRPGLQGGVLTGQRPIWELVRESDALRSFLEHLAVDAPGAVAVVLDTGSSAALRRAREAIADLRRSGSQGPFIFSTFHRTGVSEPLVLSSWSQLQLAVAGATAAADPPASEGRGARPGPLDAVLGVASVAPRGTRIVLVTEDGASAADSEAGAADAVARALKHGDIQLDTWTLGSCNDYQTLTSVTKSTGGTLGCGDYTTRDHAPGAADLKEVTLAFRHDLVEPLPVRVDGSVVALRAEVRAVQGRIQEAALRAPSGRVWPLTAEAGGRVARLSLDRLPAAGTAPWELTARGAGPDARLDAEVRGLGGQHVAATLAAPLPAVSGGVGVVRLQEPAVRSLDQSGREVGTAAAHSADRQVSRRDAAEPEWNVRVVSGKPFLVETTGNDSQGHTFTRVSNLTKVENVLIIQPPVILELSPNTQLMTRQGQSLQIMFDLTNNMEIPQIFQFNLKDDSAFLQTLRPIEASVAPQQTIQIVASLVIHQNTPDGQKDKVTLTARSVTTRRETKKSAIVYVQQEQTYDHYNPYVWATWKSTCSGAWESSNCNTNTWTVEFFIEDKDSGLLSVTTNPKGVQFREDFISGTRDPVHAYYSASCCSKKVDLIATDLKGNSHRQTYDVGSQFLGPGEIAGISMGVLAIILIIIIVVLAIVLCRRRETLRIERRLGSRLGSRE